MAADVLDAAFLGPVVLRAVDAFVPAAFLPEALAVDVVFRAGLGAFLPVAFLEVAFLATTFFATVFLVAAFLRGAAFAGAALRAAFFGAALRALFLATAFLATDFLAAAFLVVAFLAGDAAADLAFRGVALALPGLLRGADLAPLDAWRPAFLAVLLVRLLAVLRVVLLGIVIGSVCAPRARIGAEFR